MLMSHSRSPHTPGGPQGGAGEGALALGGGEITTEEGPQALALGIANGFVTYGAHSIAVVSLGHGGPEDGVSEDCFVATLPRGSQQVRLAPRVSPEFPRIT